MRTLVGTALALTLIATPALAEKISVFVPQEGGGVREYISNATPQEAAILFGRNEAPPGTTGVVLEKGKPAKWTNLSPTDVNEKYGGDGMPVVYPFPDDGKDEKRVVSTAGAIVPLSGGWTATRLSTEPIGCPASLAGQVKNQIAKMVPNSGPVTITSSFDPTAITPLFKWDRKGANSWFGRPKSLPAKAPVNIGWAVQILSPRKIKNTQTTQFTSPLFGNCRFVTVVDYDKD